MASWRIHYADGSSYSDDDGPAELAPPLGVQVVAVADPNVGRRLDSRFDFHWYEHGTWRGGDLFGLWDYLTRPGWKKILFGRHVSADVYAAALRRALDDPTLPAKSAWGEKEWRPDEEA